MGFMGAFSWDLLTGALSSAVHGSPRTRPVSCGFATARKDVGQVHRAASVQPYAAALMNRETRHDARVVDLDDADVHQGGVLDPACEVAPNEGCRWFSLGSRLPADACRTARLPFIAATIHQPGCDATVSVRMEPKFS